MKTNEKGGGGGGGESIQEYTQVVQSGTWWVQLGGMHGAHTHTHCANEL